MPPLRPANSLGGERNLSNRVEAERRARGWSYQALANNMERVGYPIQPSAIHKITSASRRITLDEAIAYAQVFNIPTDELLLPPEIARSSELKSIWDQLQRNTAERLALQQSFRDQEAPLEDRQAAIMRRLGELAETDPGLRDLLPELVAESRAKYSHPIPDASAFEQVLDNYADPANRGKS